MIVALPALALTAALLPARVLSLAEAERLAQARHPKLQEARAATEGAVAADRATVLRESPTRMASAGNRPPRPRIPAARPLVWTVP